MGGFEGNENFVEYKRKISNNETGEAGVAGNAAGVSGYRRSNITQKKK